LTPDPATIVWPYGNWIRAQVYGQVALTLGFWLALNP